MEKPLQTKDIRSRNRMEILRVIMRRKQVSRVEICEITGLNKATVSTIVKELLQAGLVEETSVGSSTGGRKPIMLTQRENLGFCISMDLNVSTVRLVAADLAGNILKSSYVSLSGINYAVNFHRLCDAVQEVADGMPGSLYGLIGIGVSVRGVVDLNGTVRFIPALKWRDVDLKAMLGDVFGVPVYVENDGNLTALAEMNEWPQCSEMVVLTVDDVITAGIVSGGKLVKGYLGFANAVAHHTINCFEKERCTCGKYGCWEQYCSHLALLRHLSCRLGEPVRSVEELIHLVRQKEPAALETMERFAHYLAVGICNLIFILNSEMIVLNSRLLSALPEYLEQVKREIVLPITGEESQTLFLSRLGGDSAILGAAGGVIEQFYQKLTSALGGE